MPLCMTFISVLKGYCLRHSYSKIYQGISEELEICKKKKSHKKYNDNKMVNFWDISVDVCDVSR